MLSGPSIACWDPFKACVEETYVAIQDNFLRPEAVPRTTILLHRTQNYLKISLISDREEIAMSARGSSPGHIFS